MRIPAILIGTACVFILIIGIGLATTKASPSSYLQTNVTLELAAFNVGSSDISTGKPGTGTSDTPQSPLCPAEYFQDVCPGNYYYQHVLDLNNLGILSGYNSTPPCESIEYVRCFKPDDTVTRGQMAKIISNAAHFTEPAGAQQFEDVPPGSTFYDYVWHMASRNVVVGYPCGVEPGEPCGAGNLPYYRVNSGVNRAQMAKFTALAFGYGDPATGQAFEDVIPGNHFYPAIENLASRGIITGYPCGGPGEPCGPSNLPYYRYASLVNRGQVAKIVNVGRTFIPVPTPDPSWAAPTWPAP